MFKNTEKININSILPLFGLALLLLFSPCKLRNFIQAELGVQQTNTLNKSQSTLSQTSCKTLTTTKVSQTLSKSISPQPDYASIEKHFFGIAYDFCMDAYSNRESYKLNLTGVPLYLLYQNIQIYS